MAKTKQEFQLNPYPILCSASGKECNKADERKVHQVVMDGQTPVVKDVFLSIQSVTNLTYVLFISLFIYLFKFIELGQSTFISAVIISVSMHETVQLQNYICTLWQVT